MNITDSKQNWWSRVEMMGTHYGRFRVLVRVNERTISKPGSAAESES